MNLSSKRWGRREAALGPQSSSNIAEGIKCLIPGCSRLAEKSEGRGLAQYYCRYHIQLKSRHGSYWHATYRASDLRPYIRCAERWIKEHGDSPIYRGAYWQLEHILAGATRTEPAMRLRGRSAAYRAGIALGRLRAANISTRRLICIYLAVTALIEDDFGSHRTREFRIVQAAKAVHRLASGTHRKWDVWDPYSEDIRHTELHAYPRSSGHVLRKIVDTLEKACDELASAAVPEIIAMRTERFGPHPSHPVASKAS
jgi:hypothetical protein